MQISPHGRQCSLLCTLLAAVAPMSAGCGGGPAPAPATNDPPATVPTAGAETGAKTMQESTAPLDANDPNSNTKWIGDIPYDVFYDQPLVIAAEATSVAAPSLGSTESPPTKPEMTTPDETGTDTPPAASLASGDGPDWPSLIAADVLNEAVTKLRNDLTTNLNTLANYNRNIETIANDGACLAALAAVAEVHPQEVSWKDKSKYIRDLGYEIYMKADGTGRTPYDATSEPFEQIVAMLNGGPPPDMEPEDTVPFADIADRTELMKRIKKSYDFLRAEINTEARFKESPEDIVREASLLASFGGLISTESYDSSDEEKYKQFVRKFMQANVDVALAAGADDFASFEDARNRIQQACDACHGEYAFGGDSF